MLESVGSGETGYTSREHESYLPSGNLLAASGPLSFFCFLPTLVGTGGSYFLRLSFKWIKRKCNFSLLVIFNG